MAGTTPIYGFPYPSPGDPPDGAAQIQSLATAVEARFVIKDTQPLTQYFTSNSTYTKPANALRIEEEVQGAGGGSGGGIGTGGGVPANASGEGGGGGEGAWSLKSWAASAVGASFAVTVGAAGVGASAASPIGGTGGTSSGNGVSCTGGIGGSQGTAVATGSNSAGPGGSGGTASGGDINLSGQAGGHGRVINGQTCATAHGARSRRGAPGASRLGAGNGNGASGYGAGGGGAFIFTGTDRTGGYGGPGIVIIKTWF